MIRWLLAAVHLLGLGIGLGAIYARGQWRATTRRGAAGHNPCPRYATTSWIQLGLTLAMVLLAPGMARGMGVIAR